MKTKTKFLAVGILLRACLSCFGQAATSVQFSSPIYTVDENSGTTFITVTRGGNTNGIVSVDYATSDGIATAGADYTSQSGTLSFAAGETNKTFAIPILDDAMVEGDETVHLTLANPTGGAVLGASSNAMLTIQDNEKPVRLDSSFDPGTGVGGIQPWVHSVTVQPDGKVLIGGAFDSFNGISRNGIARLNSDGSLDPNFDPGSGAGGGDFPDIRDVHSVIALSDGKVLIAGRFKTFNAVSNSGIVRLNPDGALDNSFSPVPVGMISGERGGILSILVQPDGRVLLGGYFESVDGVKRPSIARLNSNGTLDASFNAGTGVSYTFTGYPLESMALQADGKILIGGGFDKVNGIERRQLARLNSDGSIDNEFNPAITYYPLNNYLRSIIVQPDGKLLAGGDFPTARNPRTFVARFNPDGELDPNFNPSVTLYLLSMAVQRDGKILIAGSIDAYGGIIRLNPDGSSDDSFETFTYHSNFNPYAYSIAIQTDGNVLIGGTFSTVHGLSRNGIARLLGDNTGPVSVAFDAPAYAVSEDGGAAKIHVVRLGNSRDPFTIDYATSDGTATAGMDYMPQSGTLSFGALETEKTIAIPILNDGLVEGDETINVTLSNPTSGVVLGAGPSKTVLTIVDNDTGIEFDSAEYAISEDGGTATITVRRGDDGSNSVSVAYATRDGTATAGADYIAQSGTLTFAVGETSKTFTIPIVDDGFVEDYETVNLMLSNPTGGAILGAQSNAVLTIQDNEISIVVDESFSSQMTIKYDDGQIVPGTVYSLVIQPDGRILVGGVFTAVSGVQHEGIARLDVDGSIDTSFNAPKEIAGVDLNPVGSLAVQNDGKVIIGAGFPFLWGSGAGLVARLNSNGSLDSSFAPVAQTDDSVNSVALQDDGKVLVAGSFSKVNGISHTGIVRLNVDGSLDATFNAFIDPCCGSGGVSSIAVQPDGKLLIGGFFNMVNNVNRTGIARLNTDGSLDTDFNAPFAGQIRSMEIQSNGKILVGGFFGIDGLDMSLGILRLNSDGSLDTGFTPTTSTIPVVSLSEAPGGKIFFSSIGKCVEGGCAGYIARLNADGSLDTSFRKIGPQVVVFAMATQANGNLLVGGSFSAISGVPRIGIARLYGNQNLTSVGFASANYNVSETARTATITLERIGDVSGTTTVDYITSDGTAKAGLNYFATNGTITLAPLEITKAITVPILHDGAATGPVTFNLTLGNPTGGLLLGSVNRVTVTLQDTDMGFPPDGITRQPSGEVTLALNLPSFGSYVVQSSTNLLNWSPLRTFTAAGYLSFTDTNAPNLSRRFYRILKTGL